MQPKRQRGRRPRRSQPRSSTIPNARRVYASGRGATAARTARRIDGLPRDERGVVELLRTDRPITRGDCVGGQRPCPWVSCRHHLYLEVPDTGALTLRFPHLEVWEIPQTCSLDVADAGAQRVTVAWDGGVPVDNDCALSHGEVGALLNLDRESVRGVEAGALRRIRRGGMTR